MTPQERATLESIAMALDGIGDKLATIDLIAERVERIEIATRPETFRGIKDEIRSNTKSIETLTADFRTLVKNVGAVDRYAVSLADNLPPDERPTHSKLATLKVVENGGK